jgi:hypothetical protein
MIQARPSPLFDIGDMLVNEQHNGNPLSYMIVVDIADHPPAMKRHKDSKQREQYRYKLCRFNGQIESEPTTFIWRAETYLTTFGWQKCIP